MNTITPFGSTAVTTQKLDPFNTLPPAQKTQPLRFNQQGTPQWYSDLSKLAFQGSGQTRDQWNGYYGGYTGGPVLQSLQNAATQSLAVRNPNMPAGLVGQAVQNYINTGMNGGRTGGIGHMINGTTRRGLVGL